MTLRKLGSARLTGRSAQADYLANSAAISLTVVFIIGSMMDSESCSKGLQMMTLFAFWTFLSMIVMVPAFYFSRYWQKIVIAVMWTSMLLPVRNAIRYYSVVRKIRSNWTQKLDLNMTFLGRPGELSWRKRRELSNARKKGSQGALDKDLRTFVVKEKDPKDPKKPIIKLNPDILSPAAMATTYAEARKGRCEPWQFDAENHYIYCGLHRNYYTDNVYAKAIDHDAHNMPYQRKLRHGPMPED